MSGVVKIKPLERQGMTDYTHYKIVKHGNLKTPETAVPDATRIIGAYLVYRTAVSDATPEAPRDDPAGLFAVIITGPEEAVLFPEGAMRLESRGHAYDLIKTFAKWLSRRGFGNTYVKATNSEQSDRISTVGEFRPAALRDCPDEQRQKLMDILNGV